MAKKKVETKPSVKNSLGLKEDEYNNYLAVTSKAKEKIKAHKRNVAAREAAVAKLAQLGITEADIRAMGL